MEAEIKVVVAEARDLLRQGILSELAGESGIAVAGEALTARQAIELAGAAQPDVFVLSASLPGEAPTRLARTLTTKNATKVLIFGHALPPDEIFEFLKMGATGYLKEDAPAGRLVKAIQTVHRGEMWVPRCLMARFFRSMVQFEPIKQSPDATYPCGLSQREAEVLFCLKKGYCNRDIARELFISEKTVKTHLGNIFKKLNVSQRLQAVMVALKQGLE